MAARGRGGKTTSLTHEQLQAMGVVGKDAMQQVQTVPPPTFPTLLNRPTKIDSTEDDELAIVWKEKFLKHLHESPYYKTTDEEQEVTTTSLGAWEKWAEMILGPKKVIPEEYNWKRMPKELHISRRKRKLKAGKLTKLKKPKTENAEDKLKVLEEKEKLSSNQNDVPIKTKTEDTDEDENGEEEIMMDEEMDDENDYGNSYFDNGEAYNEEDDNLDDGPVY